MSPVKLSLSIVASPQSLLPFHLTKEYDEALRIEVAPTSGTTQAPPKASAKEPTKAPVVTTTIVDDKEKTERPETFYRVMVRTEKNHLGTEADPLPIIPGMVTTVEILTGEKSVLDYILKPARTLRSDALREH